MQYNSNLLMFTPV